MQPTELDGCQEHKQLGKRQGYRTECGEGLIGDEMVFRSIPITTGIQT